MATEKQFAANQKNSQQSHGPTSQAGLEASSGNNFKHGLALHHHERFILLEDEDAEKFASLADRLRREHNPESETQFILVRRMAESEWLRARALRFQTECMLGGVEECDSRKLSLFIRYQTTHERAFYKALNELQNLREQRSKSEIGIKAQELKQAAETRAAEALSVKKEAQILRRDQFEFKKAACQAKKTPLPVQTTPEVSPSGQEMAA